MINLKSNQKGNFTVEFAIVGVVFALLLVFTADIVVKLSTKGKLDRMSFSAVSILKERTQFYDANFELTPTKDKNNQELPDAEVSSLYNIISQSLNRTMSNYQKNKLGMAVEVQTFSDKKTANTLVTYSKGNLGCEISTPLSSETDLSIVTSWDRRASLYRVTLCYDTENWFGDLVGKSFTTVYSNSVMIGR